MRRNALTYLGGLQNFDLAHTVAVVAFTRVLARCEACQICFENADARQSLVTVRHNDADSILSFYGPKA